MEIKKVREDLIKSCNIGDLKVTTIDSLINIATQKTINHIIEKIDMEKLKEISRDIKNEKVLAEALLQDETFKDDFLSLLKKELKETVEEFRKKMA